METPSLPQDLISGLADVYHTSHHRAGDRQARKREDFLFLFLLSSSPFRAGVEPSWCLCFLPQALPSEPRSSRR